MNKTNHHGTDAYYAPDPENDTLLQAIAACLTEDGHQAQVQGKGSAAQITVTTPTGTIWTIDTKNGQAVIYPANIYVLESEENFPVYRIDLADPDMFTKITKRMKDA